MKYRCRKDGTEFEPKPTTIKVDQKRVKDVIVKCPKCGGTNLEFVST